MSPGKTPLELITTDQYQVGTERLVVEVIDERPKDYEIALRCRKRDVTRGLGQYLAKAKLATIGGECNSAALGEVARQLGVDPSYPPFGRCRSNRINST